jgi:hypothetical protein
MYLSDAEETQKILPLIVFNTISRTYNKTQQYNIYVFDFTAPFIFVGSPLLFLNSIHNIHTGTAVQAKVGLGFQLLLWRVITLHL